MEKSYEDNMKLHLIFIDSEQIFDQLKRNLLMEALREIKIPNIVRELIKITMKESNAIIKTK